MRLVLLALLPLLTVEAPRAQAPPPDSGAVVFVAPLVEEAALGEAVPLAPARRLRLGQTVLTFYTGYLVGGTSGILVGLAVDRLTGSTGAALIAGLAAYPVGVAGVTYGMGQLFRVSGSLPGVIRGVAVGAGVGLAAGAVVLTLGRHSLEDESVDDPSDVILYVGEAVSVIVGAAALYALGASVGALIGFNRSVRPSVVADATGRLAPGVTLRVGL